MLREIVENLNEELDIQTFSKNVEEMYLKHFPNGYAKVIEKKGFSGRIISGDFGLVGDRKDLPNGYRENEKVAHSFMMFDNGDGTWQFKTGSSKIYINPAEGSFNTMDSIRTKMGNNSKITLEKAEKKLQKFFDKLAKLVKENIDNIYGIDDLPQKYKIIK